MHLLAEGIEAEVVVHAGGLLGMGGRDLHELGGLLRADGQRLLAEDVLAGLEGPLGVLEVDVVGRGDVDGVIEGSASSSSRVL